MVRQSGVCHFVTRGRKVGKLNKRVFGGLVVSGWQPVRIVGADVRRPHDFPFPISDFLIFGLRLVASARQSSGSSRAVRLRGWFVTEL